MTPLPNADKAVVAPEKIAGYLLSDTHPVGSPKSVFFKSFGFSSDQPNVLADALIDHAKAYDALPLPSTVLGAKHEISGPLRCPDGRMPRVKSVWIIDAGGSAPRLVTAIPD